MPKFHGKYAYLSSWQYVLLSILYLIPGIGLIFLLVHSFSTANENRRNYARSYFARLLLILIITAVAAGIFYLAVGQETFLSTIEDWFYQIQDIFTGGGLKPGPYIPPKGVH